MVGVLWKFSLQCILAAKIMQLCRLMYCKFLSCQINCKICLDVLKWTARRHFVFCFTCASDIATNIHLSRFYVWKLKYSVPSTFSYALEDCKSLVIPRQGGTGLVCISTESTTDIKDAFINMYQAHVLCSCKPVHRLLTKNKFRQQNLGQNSINFLSSFRKKLGMDVVTDTALLICRHYTNEGHRNY
jgi:hypothetical protein